MLYHEHIFTKGGTNIMPFYAALPSDILRCITDRINMTVGKLLVKGGFYNLKRFYGFD
jgi:hypothetical protein